ncbi:hypothetical protein [Allorhodopirellula solitaria]|uniref:Uncharacterized protein n=1 Tax=Allorhodopirellula solitaria TaxID=2527987 RepID=A0A5C5YHK0_9BACT|nr:hypothetical protein [Allorhodopirellula solitaria]TWT74235.1 hypothetical protein CA85_11220 [Allorhodopirellula solitaria]
MRTLLFLGLAIGAAFMANWFTIERDGDSTRIDINKKEIRNDTKQAIDRGREILDNHNQGRQTATSADGYPPAEQSWPPPQPSAPAANDGYARPASYGNQPAYGNQNYGGQPYDNQSYDNQPHDAPAYNKQPASSGYGTTYPTSTRSPPPWQQQPR